MKVAMILAAGRGERLRPLTDKIPKAMCPVKNKPLIEHHVERLSDAGFERIVINHAYLGGQIRQHLGDGKRWGIQICYAPEPPGGLETGGGLYNALPWLGHEPFLTINADIVTDFDFSTLALDNTARVKLVLVKNPKHKPMGDFGLDGAYLTNGKTFTYSGIACYHPTVFEGCQPGRYSVTPLLRTLVKTQLALGVFFTGCWIDIGTPEQLGFAQNA